jgi:LysM repeat protein
MSTVILSPSLAALTDEIGSIRAEIKRLEELNKQLTDQLKASGAGKHKGSIYKSTVYTVDPKDTVNWKAVAMHFDPSRQLIKAHTSTSIASLAALVSPV